MAANANNYFSFTHGGAQYGAAATPAAYPTAQTGYAVAPTATAATYGVQRPAYDPTYQVQAAATQGTYAAASAVTYDYGYGRPATYDATKTYYQQAAAATTTATYAAAPQTYDATQSATTKVTGYQTAQYVAGPTRNVVQPPKPPAVPTTTYTNPTYVPQTSYGPVASTNVTNTVVKQPTVTTTNPSTYSNYDAALYSAATMYVAQQNKTATGNHIRQSTATWTGYKKSLVHGSGPGGISKSRAKPIPKPQQLHYCEVCKISCVGPRTYHEHLGGQKHKKREASLKMVATAAASQNRGNTLHCELCDVTCTGNDAYAAHVRGAKHQKVVKLHQKLGKPIPTTDPLVKKVKINFIQACGSTTTLATVGGTSTASTTISSTTTTTTTATAISSDTSVSGTTLATDSKETLIDITTTTTNIADTTESLNEEENGQDDIKPVGVEYIDEMKDVDGKLISFNCKLCECKFNDPNAKEMHMKGRRHRLQYKKKVQPDLIVDFKNASRQRKIQEAKQQRALLQAEYWNRRRSVMHDADDCGGPSVGGGGDDKNAYWDERRRYDDEYEYMSWSQRGPGAGGGSGSGGFPGRGNPMLRGPGAPMGHSFFGMLPGGRRPESSDDRHVIAHHAAIYPKEEELQSIQRIVSHTERALKFVSDILTDKTVNGNAGGAGGGGAHKGGTDKKGIDNQKSKEDGRDNQLFSFQRDTEGKNVRLLKGVMRVGLLAKGLLLQGDTLVQLVVLCAEKPTLALLKRVYVELPMQLKKLSDDHKYTVTITPEESALFVNDTSVTVKVSLTSPLLREQDTNNAAIANEKANLINATEDLLPREPCLQALAALRHAKWFQARATGLQSCVMIMRIFRDLCHRVPTWTPLSQWAMELLIEKVISSANVPLSPGDCLRRIIEATASGIIINGPGLLDPCEKEVNDALQGLTKQQREDLTVTAQQFLRQIAFRQVHKVLGMDLLPAPKFQQRGVWRFTRKRRRSAAEGNDVEGADSKVCKKELGTAGATATAAAAANTSATNKKSTDSNKKAITDNSSSAKKSV